ncbi:predicted protein [Aspergillus terreus NIH2624]|uniref:Serine hydrolase FSH domain-containing protein n=1 Tax=Aspergillus terreus (strain NIH 2624 / FGSC A1156) TaxID=341663 RepID=Q0CGB1_ASPTN|nr:uncharacterized protein ATEG_07281 [Aspergillus terreus NIH2624]EAU32665.1 predicted protein [Aspergillus terreus NIH2624]
MRFLCLHGIGSSAQVFETQLSALTAGLGSRYEFVFLQGDIPSEAGPGVEGVADGPYYSFFSLPTPDQLHAAYEVIDQALDTEGPFDGIMGFSQGASLAASYLLSKSNPEPPVKCAVFFCASMPFDVGSSCFCPLEDGSFQDEVTGEDVSGEIQETIPELLDRDKYPGQLGQRFLRRYESGSSTELCLPTVHVYSSQDPYYAQSQGLARMCQSFDREEVVHKGGHTIPWDEKITVEIIECIRRMMTSASRTQQSLVGSWSLLEYRSEVQDSGVTIHPMGQGSRGIITYAPNGYMAVQLVPAVTKKVKHTIHDLLAYTGRYWCEEQPDGAVMVKHRLEVSSEPGMDGSIQQRLVTLSDNQLTLSCPAFVNLEVRHTHSPPAWLA